VAPAVHRCWAGEGELLFADIHHGCRLADGQDGVKREELPICRRVFRSPGVRVVVSVSSVNVMAVLRQVEKRGVAGLVEQSFRGLPRLPEWTSLSANGR
jgi:hypothetical protein